ncbi:hypothetical protein RJT34_22892 [Clitoria ternatea]|uniref:Uncharacterized protein n=1 Tax=Clitoria ternatea TaxID=43366 RepID=A0AAN9FRT2_CLITE
MSYLMILYFGLGVTIWTTFLADTLGLSKAKQLGSKNHHSPIIIIFHFSSLLFSSLFSLHTFNDPLSTFSILFKTPPSLPVFIINPLKLPQLSFVTLPILQRHRVLPSFS